MRHKKSLTLLVLSGALAILAGKGSTLTANDFADQSIRQIAIELTEFIHIPGPNPIIKTGELGAWDDENTETSDAIEDMGTYYVFYHSMSRNSPAGQYNYQIGVATSTSPLGPFKKYGDGPVLGLGPEGSFDHDSIACAMILKEGDRKYLMFYGGRSESWDWSIGLATAEHLLGPWTRYEGNPVLKDFGYLGGVIKQEGEYRLYSVHPVSAPGYQGDYGPIRVAVGKKAEGPYVKYAGNPVLEQGSPGDWDDGGPSEAEVLFHNGMYHMFYGGTRIHGPRLESIGYAYSFDGYEWFKYGKNPVAQRQAVPNAAAFAEVHCIFEPPFIYAYHTLRPETDPVRPPIDVEHIGVEVLVTQRPFSIDMPALYLDNLAGGATTKLDDAAPIALSNTTRLALTAECKYPNGATKPIRVHVRASYDGLQFDTGDLYTLDNDLDPGQLSRKTFALKSNVKFIKVIAENLDAAHAVSDLKITATLGG